MIKTIADQYLAQNAGRRYPFRDDTELPDWLTDAGVLDFRCTLFDAPAGTVPEARLTGIERIAGGIVRFTAALFSCGIQVDELKFDVPSDIAGRYPYTSYATGLRSNGAITVTTSAIPPESDIPSAHSYVQDGLVAMWDGIENVGWGTHDSSATTWKDLVGNRMLSIGSNSFGDDCFLATAPVGASSSERIDLYTGTLELVCEANPTSNSVFVRLGGYSNQYAIGMYYVKTTGKIGVGNPLKSSPFNVSTDRYCAYSYDGSNSNAYVNGLPSLISDGGNRAYGTICIGGAGGRTGSLNGKVFCTRVYSRVLSDSEIAANYAVDVQRFYESATTAETQVVTVDIPFAATTVVCDSLKVMSLQSTHDAADARDESDPAGRNPVAALTGEIVLAEGRNTEPYLDGNHVRLDIFKGAGLGENCQAVGSGQRCDNVLFTINGERPGSDGDIRIVGEDGITVTPDQGAHALTIKMDTVARDRMTTECASECSGG